jgi:1-acyl-sn-glycerol-3-phosphate acyltransferase
MSSRSLFFARYQDEVDKYGFNVTAYEPVEPFVRFLYEHWFCVRVTSIGNIPAAGNAVMFGNHSGTLPVDGYLLYDGIINHHPNPRRVRYLVTKFLLDAPLVGKGLRGYGCIPPDYETATELLRRQELVYFYPEAEKGTGKLFKDRYKLVNFHSGFVRAAIETQSPMVPVVTIGGDEIYPLLFNIKPLAKLLDAPYFPVTPFFPLLPFPFNVLPLPIKILICVFPPFRLRYTPEEADNEELVNQIASDIRKDAQAKVTDLLKIRTSPFSNWNMDAVNAYLRQTDFCSPRMNQHRLMEDPTSRVHA